MRGGLLFDPFSEKHASSEVGQEKNRIVPCADAYHERIVIFIQVENWLRGNNFSLSFSSKLLVTQRNFLIETAVHAPQPGAPTVCAVSTHVFSIPREEQHQECDDGNFDLLGSNSVMTAILIC